MLPLKTSLFENRPRTFNVIGLPILLMLHLLPHYSRDIHHNITTSQHHNKDGFVDFPQQLPNVQGSGECASEQHSKRNTLVRGQVLFPIPHFPRQRVPRYMAR